MNDYIERKKAIELIQPHVKPQTVYGEGYLQAIEHATDILELMPAADVQPVNQWISVNDRLPEDNRPVLCFVIDTTGESSGYVIGSCEHSEFWFLKIGDNKQFSFPYMQIKVTHWIPLPEPPKGGDTEWK